MKKRTIVLIIIGSVLLLGIIIGIIVINNNNNTNRESDLNNNVMNNKEDDISDNNDNNSSNNNNSNNNLNDNIDNNPKELIKQTFSISDNNLYINKYEKQYLEYSRMTELKLSENVKVYISENKLFYSSDGQITNLNINNETPKYLALGTSSCIPYQILVLTNNGNVYQFSIDLKVNLLYGGGDAIEIFFINNEYKIFTTCGTSTPYFLVNNNIYTVQDNRRILIKDYKPFSISFFVGDDAKMLLYPDGSINSYVYSASPNFYSTTSDIINEFVLGEDGNIILISFIYQMNGNIYIIDIKGNLYSVDISELDAEKEPRKFNIKKENNYNLSNINYVEVSSIAKNYTYVGREYISTKEIDYLTLHDVNGNSVSFSKANNDNIYFVDETYLYK